MHITSFYRKALTLLRKWYATPSRNVMLYVSWFHTHLPVRVRCTFPDNGGRYNKETTKTKPINQVGINPLFM